MERFTIKRIKLVEIIGLVISLLLAVASIVSAAATFILLLVFPSLSLFFLVNQLNSKALSARYRLKILQWIILLHLSLEGGALFLWWKYRVFENHVSWAIYASLLIAATENVISDRLVKVGRFAK